MRTERLSFTNEMLKLTSDLSEFKGRWSLHALPPTHLLDIKKSARIDSVVSNLRLEGAKTSNSQVETFLKKYQTQDLLSKEEQLAINYFETLNHIHSSFQELRLTEDLIKRLHGCLHRHNSNNLIKSSEYKTFPNHVGLTLVTVSPFETPSRMRKLIEWSDKQFREQKMHPLLVIATFTAVFLQIHPFQQGNGPLSRVLMTLLLLQHGYTYMPYCSLERIIEENYDAYNLSLRHSLGTLSRDNAYLSEWILFFLRSLKTQMTTVESSIHSGFDTTKLPALSLLLIDQIKQQGAISVSDAVFATKANRNTIKAHFKRLVENNFLEILGAGRGARYRIRIYS